jgi:glutathione synthase/RimK-type ligase-like ATP-grasp enzyme
LRAIPEPIVPPPIACELAVAAAAAIGGDLVGVDLLPLGPRRYVVLEINAAVDFTSDYSVGEDVFDGVVSALVRRAGTRPTSLPPPESAAAAA